MNARLTDAQLLARRARPLTEEEKAVIRERRYGWEQAECATLAHIFQTTPQHIASICRVKRQAHVPNVPANVERTAEEWR